MLSRGGLNNVKARKDGSHYKNMAFLITMKGGHINSKTEESYTWGSQDSIIWGPTAEIRSKHMPLSLTQKQSSTDSHLQMKI